VSVVLEKVKAKRAAEKHALTVANQELFTKIQSGIFVFGLIVSLGAMIASVYQAKISSQAMGLMLEQVRLEKRLALCEDLVELTSDISERLKSLSAQWTAALVAPTDELHELAKNEIARSYLLIENKLEVAAKIEPRAILLYPTLRPILKMFHEARVEFIVKRDPLPNRVIFWAGPLIDSAWGFAPPRRIVAKSESDLRNLRAYDFLSLSKTYSFTGSKFDDRGLMLAVNSVAANCMLDVGGPENY
jgi:F0F1-type ATP synthase membrane subunit c/vacuolar-type H+-ATPase subunit K